MRAYKILSAVIVAAMMLALPMIIAVDSSEASVDEQTSAVYFKSKENLSPEEIGKFMDIDVSASSIQEILVATSDFNFDDFTISDIRTSEYNVEAGIASRISDGSYLNETFRIVDMKIEFKLTANKDGAELYAGTFNGDADYGFTKSVSVKQNDTMTFKGTLRTESSLSKEQYVISSEGKYYVNKIKDDTAERTELVLDAVYKSVSGMEQSFKFSSSFNGFDTHSVSQEMDADNIKNLAIGDVLASDNTDSVNGKGTVSMEYEGKTYKAESKTGSYQTVYSGPCDADEYSGKKTYAVSSETLKTEKEYKSQYSEVKLKDLFDKFTGTNQELLEQIGTVGSMTIDDFDKVQSKAVSEISDIKGDSVDTSKQITNAVVAVLIGVIIILIVAVIVTDLRKKRW